MNYDQLLARIAELEGIVADRDKEIKILQAAVRGGIAAGAKLERRLMECGR